MPHRRAIKQKANKRKKPVTGIKKRESSSITFQNRLLSDLAEEVEILLPELAARIAALEHLLVEKQVCSHDELVRSLEFVDERRTH